MKQKLQLWPTASLFLFSTLIELGSGILVTKPSPAEALIGQKIHLNCSTSIKGSEIHWFHYPIQQAPQRQLVYGYNKMAASYSRFQMERDNATGAFNLIIPSVALNDAGLYECQEEYGRGEQSSAQLIVLERPLCTSATDLTKIVGTNNCGIKSDQLLLSCIVQYKGNEPPVMKWRKIGEQTTIDSRIAPTKLSDEEIIYNITTDGALVNNGSAFECFATRPAAAELPRCHTTNATVISRIFPCEACSCVGAIFIFIFVVIVIGAAVAASWYFFYFQKQKEEEKETYEKYMDEVFCLNFFPFFIGAALGLYWYLRRYRPQKKPRIVDQLKNKMEKEELMSGEYKSSPETPGETPTERLERQIRELERENEDHKENEKKLLTENGVLKKRIQELEQELYSSDCRPMDYVDKPSPVHTIDTGPRTKENRPIVGLAVLGNSLFVSHEKTSAIEVYDSATYVAQDPLQIKEGQMAEPFDIAACVQESCLFVIGRLDSSKDSTSSILKIEPGGKVLAEWSSGGSSGRLSTYGSNVIVCLSDKSLVCEFTHNGELLHQVRLSPSAGFIHLSHAIQVTSVHFVVSHGGRDDRRRRVCLVDREGNIIEKCEIFEKRKLPVCLLNDRSRSILVGYAEGRIILLNSKLIFQRNLIGKADNCIASRISFDETEKRLFVARNKVSLKPKDLKAAQVLVFNVK